MRESEITIVSNRNKICHFFNHLPNCTSDRLDNCLITSVDDSDLNSASSLIRRSPAVPHSSEGSATISRAANLIKTLPMKTVIQSQLLADYLCKDPHVCNSSVTHSSDDHHQHILHCVFWNSINGKSLWFFRLLKYARIENTHVLNAVWFPLPIPSKKCPLVVDGSVLQEKLFLIYFYIKKVYQFWNFNIIKIQRI